MPPAARSLTARRAACLAADEDPERTVVDVGREWVEAYAAERPALEAALADGAVRLAAKRTTRRWQRACEQRVRELRRGEAVRSQMTTSHLHRSCTAMVHALITQARPLLLRPARRRRTRSRGCGHATQHSTFSTFLAEPLGGLQRWQSASRGA